MYQITSSFVISRNFLGHFLQFAQWHQIPFHEFSLFEIIRSTFLMTNRKKYDRVHIFLSQIFTYFSEYHNKSTWFSFYENIPRIWKIKVLVPVTSKMLMRWNAKHVEMIDVGFIMMQRLSESALIPLIDIKQKKNISRLF